MGKISAMKCPNCGGSLAIPKNGEKMFFCPHCDYELEYNNGDVNIKINKLISKERHTIDHAMIAELEYKDREDRRVWKAVAVYFIVLGIMVAGMYLPNYLRDIKDKFNSKSYIEKGYVCPGKSAEDFKGDKEKMVVKQLESVGFTNIETVAVGGGLAIWNWGKVTEVMIDGNTNYGAYAYFPPDAPIVVAYK